MAAPAAAKEPPTRIPRKASRFAASLWAKSVGERIQLLIDPKPETAADFIRAGIESFEAEDLAQFVRTNQDLIPILYEWLELDNGIVRPWARSVIRIWWPHIFAAARDPVQMLADIRAHDPAKAAVLETVEGRRWFNATIYRLIVFFRAYGMIEGDGEIVPPPNMPERLKLLALKGASGVIERVRNRQA